MLNQGDIDFIFDAFIDYETPSIINLNIWLMCTEFQINPDGFFDDSLYVLVSFSEFLMPNPSVHEAVIAFRKGKFW